MFPFLHAATSARPEAKPTPFFNPPIIITKHPYQQLKTIGQECERQEDAKDGLNGVKFMGLLKHAQRPAIDIENIRKVPAKEWIKFAEQSEDCSQNLIFLLRNQAAVQRGYSEQFLRVMSANTMLVSGLLFKTDGIDQKKTLVNLILNFNKTNNLLKILFETSAYLYEEVSLTEAHETELLQMPYNEQQNIIQWHEILSENQPYPLEINEEYVGNPWLAKRH